jgi:hypothetical protein
MLFISFYGGYFMVADKKMTEKLRQDFSALNETNKRKIVDMAKFLVLTQNTLVPRLLKENTPADMPPHTQEDALETL